MSAYDGTIHPAVELERAFETIRYNDFRTLRDRRRAAARGGQVLRSSDKQLETRSAAKQRADAAQQRAAARRCAAAILNEQLAPFRRTGDYY